MQGPVEQGGQPPYCMRKQAWQVPCLTNGLGCAHIIMQHSQQDPWQQSSKGCISLGYLRAAQPARMHVCRLLAAEQEPRLTDLIVPHSQHDARPSSAGCREPQIVCFGGGPALLILGQPWGVEAAACNRQRPGHGLLQCLITSDGSCQRYGTGHVHGTSQDMARQCFEV